jgi:hypothetical protein
MASEYVIEFGPNAKVTDVSEHSKAVLREIMEASSISTIKITSTARDAYDQARVMYDNIVSQGVSAQKKLYVSAGDKVIDVYVAAKKDNKDRNETISLMKAKVLELGPTKVSNHAVDVSKMNVFDVAPSSIPKSKKKAWEKAIKSNSKVKRFIFPPTDPGYHFEIEQPASS